MDTIRVLDKDFSRFITSGTIEQAVDSIARAINNSNVIANPLFVVVLNGAFMFAADLMKKISFPCEISFVKFASYSGTASTGKVTELIGLGSTVAGRTVYVVEDIIDTGLTMQGAIEKLKQLGAAEVIVVTLLFKPSAFRCRFRIDHTGMEIPNDFIVGYGLDYSGYGRNLPDIYKIINT